MQRFMPFFYSMKTPNFTQKQVKEMYQILFEIHDALKDKSMNKGSIMKLSQYEIGWLIGIEELLDKINENNIPVLQDSG